MNLNYLHLHRRNSVLWLLALGFLTVREANAYTDPGTGALLWQMLAAGLVGVMFYFRKFTNWFGKKKKAKD
jgi:O-antigen/teichoic acid export membrane protein